VKQIKTSQIFDVETAGEMALQFDCSKHVKTECQASAVTEVDFATVSDVVLFQSADIFESTKPVGVLPTGRTVVMKTSHVRSLSICPSDLQQEDG
jgi:hypothetical protein